MCASPLLPLQMALDGRVPCFKGKLPWGWQAIMSKLSQYHLWTGRLGMLQSTGSPRVGHNWVTELMDSLWGASSQQFFFFFSFLVKLQADGSRLHISFSVKALLSFAGNRKEEPSKCPHKLCSWKVFWPQGTIFSPGSGRSYRLKQLFARQVECLEEGIQFFILMPISLCMTAPPSLPVSFAPLKDKHRALSIFPKCTFIGTDSYFPHLWLSCWTFCLCCGVRCGIQGREGLYFVKIKTVIDLPGISSS